MYTSYWLHAWDCNSMDDFLLYKPRPQVIVVKKRLDLLPMKFIQWLVFIFIWYGILFALSHPDKFPVLGVPRKPISVPFFWLMFSLPLLRSVSTLYKFLVELQGRRMTFDGIHRIIINASGKVVRFADVESVDIREIKTDKVIDAIFQLSLRLKSAPTVVIGSGHVYNSIAGAATDISNILQVEVTKDSKIKTPYALDWTGVPPEPKIKLPYTRDSLIQVLRWAQQPGHSGYTHEDIVEWCDNFYCEYLDADATREIERLMPVLAEIREQWDVLLEREINPSRGITISNHLRLPEQRFNQWLNRI